MRTATLRIRESFWFFPAVLGVLAVVLAQLLVVVDQAVVDGGVRGIPFLDALSASGGRAILTTIGTSMLTVAGTSFSITISVLATTSSTYGPRLVRNFMADRANQLVLAAFTSTFLYAIVVLRSVHTAVDDGSAFVPVIAIHVAVLLGLVDVAVLVFFIHHIASSVQITALQRQVQVDLEAAVDHAFRSEDEDGASVAPVAPVEPVGRGGQEVRSTSHGYVQSVEWERLVALAAGADRVVDMVVMPGDHVLEGDVLLRVVERAGAGATGSSPTGEGPDDDRLRSAVTLGASRTPVQDVGFALQQLVEIAVRGLASGTNDPYTAVSALDLSATALVPLWRERTAVTAYLDEEQVARVLPHWCTAEELVDSVFAGVRTYGAEHPLVVEAAERLLDRLGRDCSARRRQQLDRIRADLRAAAARP